MAFKIDPEQVRRARESLTGDGASGEWPEREKTPEFETDYWSEPETTKATSTLSKIEKSDYDDGEYGVGFGSGEIWIPDDEPVPTFPETKKTTRVVAPVETRRRVSTVPRPVEMKPVVPDEPISTVPEVVAEEPAPGFAHGMISGYVHGLNELRPEQIPGKMSRWVSSMFSFVPYTRDRVGTYFTVKPDRYGDAGARQVIVYGVMMDGFLSNGSHVAVKGRLRGNGTIRANKVYMVTDESMPPSRITIGNEISPVTVWILTIIAIGFLYSLIRLAMDFTQGAIKYIQVNFETVVIVGVIIVWALYRLARFRQRFRIRRRRF